MNVCAFVLAQTQSLHAGVCGVPAIILLGKSRAAEEVEDRDTGEQEGAAADECAGSVREVGEVAAERGQGPGGPREAQ